MQPGQVAVVPTSKRPLFYGWVIAVAASFGTACSISVFIPATISLMVGPLTQAFHWSPQSIFAVIALVAGMTAIVAPFIGELIDRIGVARMHVPDTLPPGAPCDPGAG